MQKKLSIRFSKVFEGKSYHGSHQPIFQAFGYCVILIAIIQFSVLKVKANFDEKNIEIQNAKIPTIEQDIRELKPGETIERQAEVKEIHGYQITLEAGTSVEITIGQRNIAVQLAAILPDSKNYSVAGQKIPDGKELSRVLADSGETLVEPMVIVADKTDNYILKLNFYDSGTYSISCAMRRAATEKDRKYAAAGKLFAEIRQSVESGEPYWKMRDKIEERAAIYRSIDDKKSFALSLKYVGYSYSTNADWGKAIRHHREALELFRSLNSVPDIISSLWLVGRASHEIGDYQTSINSYSEILSLSRSIADKKSEAGALHQLGVVYHLIADEQKAREFYEQSLEVSRSITPPTISSLNGIGVSLTNIGNLYRAVGAGEIAIDFFTPRTTNDRQKALEYYQQALEAARRTKKLFPDASTLEGFNLQQIGNTYKELGNYSEALNYLNQSLEISKIRNSRAGQTNILVSIGNLYILKGEYPKGFEYFEQAITLLRAGSYPGNQIGYLNGIAKDYYRAGETQKALELFNEVLDLSRSRGQQDHLAASLFEIARIERDLGNFNNARNKIEQAIQTVESLRAKIISQDVRTTYFTANKRYYDFYIDLLMQVHKSQPEKGFDVRALEMSEKARSRSLLDLLTLSKIDIKQGVNPNLLDREKEVREQLSEKANQQSRLSLAKHTKEEAKKISREVSNLTADYEETQYEIRNKSPRYAALTQPKSLDAKQIQQLLDSGTILLEYSLGEKKSYLWMVAPDSIASFDLASREEIETQARRVYELLTARNQILKDETDAQRRARIKTADDQYPETAARLSQMLLSPIASQIGNKRLLIVPDGALNYIPFSVLPSPKSEDPANFRQTLGVNNEIVSLPSASTLSLLREDALNRKPAPKMLAVFADPVFNRNDIRSGSPNAIRTKIYAKRSGETTQSGVKGEKPASNRDFERAVTDVGLSSENSAGLPRLPFSRREADSIFKVAPKNLSLKELDFRANKLKVFNSNLEQYRMLHFATHGLLNSRHPELSGIVLSLVDESGRDVDGFLRLQDIYNLKLSADLVVLSACNTALGKDVKGEGLIGLTRGFMYAGAPRIVASLWKVDDAATAVLMTTFYRKLLTENLRPAAALRAAQLEMMKLSRYKSPYYWAPFIIQGEWK